MLSAKNIIRGTLMAVLMGGLAYGQGLTGYGAKVGLNLAIVSSDTLETYGIDTKMRLGFAVGGYATFEFGLPVFIQAEVLLSRKGCNWESELELFGTTTTFKGDAVLNYIDINPLAVYPINDNIRVFAGPSIGLSIGAKVNVDGGAEDQDIEVEDINGVDVGLIIGASYRLSLLFGDLEVEARYSLGLENASKLTNGNVELLDIKDFRNNIIQIIVGYAF